jgi:hypothetical protein
MRDRFIFFLLMVSLTWMPATGYGQKPGEVTPQAESKEVGAVVDLPVKEWAGKKFIFLEKPKNLQKWGYKLSLQKERVPSKRDYNPKWEVPVSKNLRYDRFVGKTISCVEVEEKPGNFDFVITFVEAGENLKLFGFTYQGHLDGIAPNADLARAKERWQGKTIYSLERHLNDSQPNSDRQQKIPVKVGEALKVLDVQWNWDTFQPLRVMVEKGDGEKGFLPAAFSWTNIFAGWWKKTRPWEDVFWEVNPREKWKWGGDVWKAIDEGSVTEGMTKEQVRLSWGKPEKITPDLSAGVSREQWFFESKVLIFEGQEVAAIQTRGAR